MSKAKDIKKSLTDIKNEIYNIYFADKHGGSYQKLIELDNVDKKLHETLLMVHSNYITSQKEQNLATFKFVSKLLDAQIEMCNIVEDMAEEKIRKESSGPLPWLTTANIVKLAVPVIGIIFAFWLMSFISPTAFSSAANFFLNLIGQGKGG